MLVLAEGLQRLQIQCKTLMNKTIRIKTTIWFIATTRLLAVVKSSVLLMISSVLLMTRSMIWSSIDDMLKFPPRINQTWLLFPETWTTCWPDVDSIEPMVIKANLEVEKIIESASKVLQRNDRLMLNNLEILDELFLLSITARSDSNEKASSLLADIN